MKVKFATSHGQGRSFVSNGGELINGYAQVANDAKEQAYIVGAPGTRIFSTLNEGEITTAAIGAFGKLVAITEIGTYLVDSNGVVARIGDGIAGDVDVAYNGIVVMAVNGFNGYVITETSVTEITDQDFYPADRVEFIDGYFVLNRKGTGQYFITGLYSTSIDALDFATAESAPDYIVSIVALRREIWLLGENSVEVHYNSGATFPFARMQGATINFGCASPKCAVEVDQSVFWLSDKGIIYQSVGYQARRVSTHEIEEEIGTLKSDWATSFGMTYIEDGHQFYMLTIGKNTFCYDVSTQLWHKRAHETLGRHTANCITSAFGRVLVGTQDGNICEMSRDFHQDHNGDIIVILGSIPYSNQGKFFSVSRLELDAVTGRGAEAKIEFSDDDGQTWSNFRSATLGKHGNTRGRLYWNRLGRARDKRFRVRFYSLDRSALNALQIDGGAAATVYTALNTYDGGNANTVFVYAAVTKPGDRPVRVSTTALMEVA